MEVKTIRSLVISYDECPINPRKDYEPMCTLAAVEGGKGKGYCDEVRSIEELNDIRKSEEYIAKPVYFYDHSGIVLSLTPFSDRWDSGVLGLIYITKEQAKKEFVDLSGLELIERIESVMQGEIELYSSYLNGNCYQGVSKVQKVTEIDGETFYSKQEVEDSIGGIYSEDSDGILSDVLGNLGMTEDDYESITVLDRKVK